MAGGKGLRSEQQDDANQPFNVGLLGGDAERLVGEIRKMGGVAACYAVLNDQPFDEVADQAAAGTLEASDRIDSDAPSA